MNASVKTVLESTPFNNLIQKLPVTAIKRNERSNSDLSSAAFIFEALVTRAEAKEICKMFKKDIGYGISCYNDAYIIDNNENYYRDALHAYIPLSKASMLRMLDKYLSDTFEKRGARIRVVINAYESVSRKGEYSYQMIV